MKLIKNTKYSFLFMRRNNNKQLTTTLNNAFWNYYNDEVMITLLFYDVSYKDILYRNRKFNLMLQKSWLRFLKFQKNKTDLHHGDEEEEDIGVSAELFEEKLGEESPQIVLARAAK